MNPVIDAVIELNNSIELESGLQLISEQSAVTLASTNVFTTFASNCHKFSGKSFDAYTGIYVDGGSVPLVGLESQTSNLLTLADGDIDGLLIEN